MEPIRRIPISELAVEHLRSGLKNGRWGQTLPGVARLAQDLDVSRHTVRTALRQLEAEGVLASRGLGRSRGITTAPTNENSQRPLRVAILRHDARSTDNSRTSLVLAEIMHSLEAAGHHVFYCKKSLLELKQEIPRVARMLARAQADAWLVESGSRPLLVWCSHQPTPCLALYGVAFQQQLARVGFDTVPFYRAVTRHLLSLGHRRIVLLVREPLRKPTPGLSTLAFLEEMASQGVTTSDFNLPNWEETPEGFNRLLDNLFKISPPTALIIDEAYLFFAALAYLARHGIKVPEHVSLVCAATDSLMDWCHPPIAHMQLDYLPVVRRVVRWVDAVRKGKPDRKIIKFPAVFVPGGTIGPAPHSLA